MSDQILCRYDETGSAVYTTRRYIRFEDCDPSGIVFFPNYFCMINSVVEDWWQHLGAPWTSLMTVRRIGTPTFKLETTFLRPSFFGETLDFYLKVEKLGQRSLTLEHSVTGDEEVRLQVKQILVATSLDSHQSIMWPDDVRDVILAFIENQRVFSSC